MKLPKFPFVVLDTETTGFVPRVHRVIEYACVTVKKGEVEREYEQLFSIGAEIPPVVQALTHLTNNDLKGKPAIRERAEEIIAMIEPDTIIVGQNIQFDIRMLKGEGIDLFERSWIDTSMLASIVFPELHSYSLGYVSEVLKIQHEPAHRALGDVRATLALLSRCWERLQKLSPDALDVIRQLAQKGPEGYKKFFAEITKTGSSPWLKMPAIETFQKAKDVQIALAQNTTATVELVEEALDPTFIEDVLHSLVKRDGEQYWVAVKNIEATVSRLDIPEEVSILYPPNLLVDPDAVASFLKQEILNADELTLAIKLYLYDPKRQFDMPIHGDEYPVWEGKIAATYESASYKEYVKKMGNIVLLDHEQLLKRIAAGDMPPQVRVIIDDASMLEDTATKAYGWRCSIPTLRAAAEGNSALMKFTDLVQLWVEKTRNNTDLHYITATDLQSPDAKGMAERLEEIKENKELTQINAALSDLSNILEVKNLPDRITWIETYMNGDQHINSVPKNISLLLQKTLYEAFPTSLLIPQGMAETLPAILPEKAKKNLVPLSEELQEKLPVSYPAEWEMEEWIMNAEGKSILLVASRRVIEDAYVKYTARLEEKGINMFCQGVSGGLGRMQAQFAAAKAPAILLMTPWMYEGIELPPKSVDHLLLHTLPFDHPSHAVLSRRAETFKNAFEEYTLPRLTHRIFRLLRTYFRHRRKAGDLTILDKRIESKSYGASIRLYMDRFANDEKAAGSDSPQQTLF